jgi:hypothetical protein
MVSAKAMAEIAEGLRPGFEAGALTATPIDTVPFESEVEAYARVAVGRVNRKQMLVFPSPARFQV